MMTNRLHLSLVAVLAGSVFAMVAHADSTPAPDSAAAPVGCTADIEPGTEETQCPIYVDFNTGAELLSTKNNFSDVFPRVGVRARISPHEWDVGPLPVQEHTAAVVLRVGLLMETGLTSHPVPTASPSTGATSVELSGKRAWEGRGGLLIDFLDFRSPYRQSQADEAAAAEAVAEGRTGEKRADEIELAASSAAREAANRAEEKVEGEGKGEGAENVKGAKKGEGAVKAANSVDAASQVAQAVRAYAVTKAKQAETDRTAADQVAAESARTKAKEKQAASDEADAKALRSEKAASFARSVADAAEQAAASQATIKATDEIAKRAAARAVAKAATTAADTIISKAETDFSTAAQAAAAAKAAAKKKSKRSLSPSATLSFLGDVGAYTADNGSADLIQRHFAGIRTYYRGASVFNGTAFDVGWGLSENFQENKSKRIKFRAYIPIRFTTAGEGSHPAKLFTMFEVDSDFRNGDDEVKVTIGTSIDINRIGSVLSSALSLNTGP